MTIKIVSYNIHFGRDEKSLLKSIGEIKELGVDVFCFQEVRKLDHADFIGDKISFVLPRIYF